MREVVHCKQRVDTPGKRQLISLAAKGSGMKIVHNLTFLFLAIATTAFAAEDLITVASLDKENSRRVIRASRQPVVLAKNEYYEIRGCSEHELRD